MKLQHLWINDPNYSDLLADEVLRILGLFNDLFEVRISKENLSKYIERALENTSRLDITNDRMYLSISSFISNYEPALGPWSFFSSDTRAYCLLNLFDDNLSEHTLCLTEFKMRLMKNHHFYFEVKLSSSWSDICLIENNRKNITL